MEAMRKNCVNYQDCPRKKDCPIWFVKNKHVKEVGNPKKARVLVVGMSPGTEEVIKGEVFVGASGKLLREALRNVGFSLSDCYLTNPVKCRPLDESLITAQVVKDCTSEHFLNWEVKLLNPEIIIALGKVAGYALGVTDFRQRLSDVRGKVLESPHFPGVPVIVTPHPAYFLRNPREYPSFEKDLSFAFGIWKGKVGELNGKLKILKGKFPSIKSDVVFLDTETTSYLPPLSQLICISLCDGNGNVYVVFPPFNKREFLKFIKNKKIIAYNFPFDLNVLRWEFGDFDLHDFEDVMLLTRVFRDHGSFSLKEVAYELLGVPSWDIEKAGEVDEKVTNKLLKTLKKRFSRLPEDVVHKGFGFLLTIPEKELATYTAKDVLATAEIFKRKARLHTTDFIYKELMKPLCKYVADLEFRGMRVDVRRLSALSRDFERFLEKERKAFPFSVSSPKQVGEWLFEKFGGKLDLPVTDNGKVSTSREALWEIFQATGDETLKRLILIRSVEQVYKLSISGLSARLLDGRLYPKYRLFLTSSGRLSGGEDSYNVQNIPGFVRQVFLPDEGHYLVEFDYSQMEVRCLAMLSQDKRLLEACRSEDLHAFVATQVFGKKDIAEDERKIAKSITFGLIYGGSPEALAFRTGLDKERVKKVLKAFERKFPTAWEWLEKQVEVAREHFYVTTPWGRKRFIPEIDSYDPSLRRHGENVARNHAIQSIASDMTCFGAVRLLKEFPFASLYALVHDSIVVQVPKGKAKKLKEEGIECLLTEFPHLPSVPLACKARVSDRWGEVQDFDPNLFVKWGNGNE
jgi:uracil-DNA glycosylase family 4